MNISFISSRALDRRKHLCAPLGGNPQPALSKLGVKATMLAAPPLRLRTYLLPAPHPTSHAHPCAHTPHTPTLPPSPDYGSKIYAKTATQTKNTLWGCYARVDLIPAPRHREESRRPGISLLPETGAHLQALEGQVDSSASYIHFRSSLELATLDRH